MNHEFIKNWCIDNHIEKYTINEDMTVDVHSDVSIRSRGLGELPISFNEIWGLFSINFCDLTTLKGSPKIVHGYFGCSNNLLTDLKYSPEIVHGNFLFIDNKVRDIYDITKKIGVSIWSVNNPVDCLVYRFTEIIDINNINDWIEFFNDCDIIRGDHIILDRLVFFYDYLDIAVDDDWKDEILEEYKIIY
jgi:hypothetical protein